MDKRKIIDRVVKIGILAYAGKRMMAAYKLRKAGGQIASPLGDRPDQVTQASMESFPASDPPSWSPTVAAP